VKQNRKPPCKNAVACAPRRSRDRRAGGIVGHEQRTILSERAARERKQHSKLYYVHTHCKDDMRVRHADASCLAIGGQSNPGHVTLFCVLEIFFFFFLFFFFYRGGAYTRPN
jgi:hypothetical protein